MIVPGSKRTLILCLLLVACTLGVYNGVTHNAFVNYDDDVYVTANRHVRAGLTADTLRWAFTTYDAANWHPLTWISHALDVQMFKLNPAGHHYVSVLLHSANVVLLFLLLADATRRTWPALAAAAIFAIHPLNVESVAWAAERKNILSMLFLLLALRAYQRYSAKPSAGRYAAVFVLFACGLMAKPQIITLPFLLLLWDYWPLGRITPRSGAARDPGASPHSFGWLVLEKLPLFALSMGSAVVTLAAQREGGAVRSVAEYSLGVRVENALGAYFDYIGRMFWPMRLAPMYPHPGTTLLAWQVAVAAIFVIGVTAAVLVFRDKRYLPTGWFWYLGTLVPMIGLVQVGQQSTADRYMYLPMIGLLIMLCWGLADLARQRRALAIAFGAAAAMSVAALGLLTVRQAAYWRDSETLWSRAIAVTRDNYVAHINLGQTYLNQERTDEATTEFRDAVRIRPGDPAAHLNLGSCERRNKNFSKAVQEDQAVLRLTSSPTLRAYALVNLGTDYRLLRDYPRAKESYEAGLRVNPEAALAFVGLGLIAQNSGALNDAVRNYSRAVELEPSDVGYLLLAQALEKDSLRAEAQKALEAAQRISSDMERAQRVVTDMLAE